MGGACIKGPHKEALWYLGKQGEGRNPVWVMISGLARKETAGRGSSMTSAHQGVPHQGKSGKE